MSAISSPLDPGLLAANRLRASLYHLGGFMEESNHANDCVKQWAGRVVSD